MPLFSTRGDDVDASLHVAQVLETERPALSWSGPGRYPAHGHATYPRSSRPAGKDASVARSAGGCMSSRSAYAPTWVTDQLAVILRPWPPSSTPVCAKRVSGDLESVWRVRDLHDIECAAGFDGAQISPE